jgi:hypothetical protein
MKIYMKFILKINKKKDFNSKKIQYMRKNIENLIFKLAKKIN